MVDLRHYIATLIRIIIVVTLAATMRAVRAATHITVYIRLEAGVAT